MEDESHPLLPRTEDARMSSAPLLGLIGPALFFETPRRVVDVSDHKTCALLMTRMKEASRQLPSPSHIGVLRLLKRQDVRMKALFFHFMNNVCVFI
ncbi:hypothetical protein CRE_07352 [Caenorhabditis remanei]|uniref:Uncharacterized protein n=2 Tax=Caenorhabditis remanei TaxID=31234 RepID=E3M2D7_CAERE|nr:hypothetical protein CRE_07352 [Caenorhabditis remanei]